MDDKPQQPEKVSKSDASLLSYEEMAEDPFFRDLLDTSCKTSSQSNNSVRDIGQIARLDLPADWQAGPTQENAVAADLFKEYDAPNDNDVKLCFYYRGMRCSALAGEAFHDLLKAPDHELSAEEYQSLQEILRNKDADYFSKAKAYTEAINEKRVLVVEGSYDRTSSTPIVNRTIYIDSDNTGTAVQEVYFQAPAIKFQKHLAEAEAALRSIHWK
jgi:hypothetical protein